MAPKYGRNRQRFDLALVDGDPRGEVDRLAALGLTYPDGNEFRLTAT